MTPLSRWSRGITSSTTAGVEDVTLHTLIRPARLTAEQVRLARYSLPKGSKTTNWLQATGGIDDGPSSREADAFPPETIWAAFAKRPRLLCAHYARWMGFAPCWRRPHADG